MKEFIKSSLIEFGVILLVLSLFDGFELGEWRNCIIFFEIFIVVMIFRACSLFTDRIVTRFCLLDVIIEFLTTLIIVLFFGYIFGWYACNTTLNFCAIALVVYVVCYVLGLVGTKKNADYIDGQLKKRRERIEKMKQINNEIIDKEGNNNEERE